MQKELYCNWEKGEVLYTILSQIKKKKKGVDFGRGQSNEKWEGEL